MFYNNRIVIALILCLAIIAIGTSGYMLIEGYTLFEGLYMSIITITTVGFGEVKPLSGVGRGFTIFLILIGFGSLAFAGHALVESLLERVQEGRSEIKKMKKHISLLKSHYIICGFGRVGAAATEHLKTAGSDFVIIETNPTQLQEVRGKGYCYVEGDATHENVLLEAGVKSARGLLALLNSDPDNLFIVLTTRELNPTLHIIARAEEASSEKKILQAGADSVISPFATAGKQIADDILAATGKQTELSKSSIGTNAAPQWIKVQDKLSVLGETISEVSGKMGREVVGLRRNGRDFIFPDLETKLESTDMLLVIDERQDEKNQLENHQLKPQKLVIIDDNPVILRLYTRLFQKAGFHPMTAADGREGLDLIIREKPVAAVIDFMLPVMSGIEICQGVRKNEDCQGIKLILFTADKQPETRKSALNAGADAVVIKSPEASEVIETVVQILKGN
ncbi:MAG: response regulator [Deltaproteobacteria bacterium]|jgi:voltage-gated potassium channel|nr:response regulator [Deltaproteobacteria bacterium]